MGIRKLTTMKTSPHTMISMRFLSFMFLLLFTTTRAQSPIYIYNFCQNSTGESLSTSYKTNVNNLLSWITSDSATSIGFNQTTIGNNNNGEDDVVYGNYNCRGDITGYFCQFCLNTAVREIAQRCPNSISAIIWYDICIIRYSNQSFFGEVSSTPSWNITGSKNIKDSTELGKAEDYMEGLIRKVNEANKSWAMSEFDWSDTEKRYGLVQCGRDLASDKCRQCLEDMLDIVPRCCRTKVAWAVVAPGCGMRIDDYMFYQGTNQTGSSSPMPNPAKQEGASNTKTLIIILVSVLVAVVLLSCGVYYSWSRSWLCKDGLLMENIPIASHDHVQREDSLNTDLPIIPLSVIQQITKYFSESSKLGEGGFGSVYKGTLPDGTEIAVKRLAETSGQGLEEFKNEVIFIAKLHEDSRLRVIHRDLKASNVLTLVCYVYKKMQQIDQPCPLSFSC